MPCCWVSRRMVRLQKQREMKYRVNYAYFDQSKIRAAKWEQREKDFETMEEAKLFVNKIDWNVSVRNVNIQPVP